MLNAIIKFRQKEGLPCWKRVNIFMLPTTGSGTNRQLVGPATSPGGANNIVTGFNQNTLSALAALGATTVTATTAANVNIGDTIGFAQSDSSMFWTTVTALPGGNQITLSTGLSVGCPVAAVFYNYTASTQMAQKPLHLWDAWRVAVSNRQRVQMQLTPYNNMWRVINDTSASIPVQIAYLPDSAFAMGVTAGNISQYSSSAVLSSGSGAFLIWPQFSGGNTFLQCDVQYPFQDVTQSTDDVDFPQSFYLPLMLQLASFLGPKYGLTLQERTTVFREAEMYFKMAIDANAEDASILLMPAVEGQTH